MRITGTHPYADKFPMLPPDEHEALRESIKANGLRNPVVIDTEGLIVDGRNRNKACEELGIAPETITYEGTDIAEYVIDCNVTRRNMSTGARAMATALVLVDDGRRENGRWRRGSVDIGTSANSESSWQARIKECGVVLDFKPDIAERVAFGEVALKDAYQQAKAIKDSAERDKIMERERKKRAKQEEAEEAERNASIIAKLEQAGSKYLDLINDGTMKPASALAAFNADNRKEQERLAAERKNDEQQARAICKLLEDMYFLTFDNQREWAIRSVAKYPDSVSHYTPENHTPARIHELADYLHTYANELETFNAA